LESYYIGKKVDRLSTLLRILYVVTCGI